MRTITLEQQFATPAFLRGRWRALSRDASDYAEDAVRARPDRIAGSANDDEGSRDQAKRSPTVGACVGET